MDWYRKYIQAGLAILNLTMPLFFVSVATRQVAGPTEPGGGQLPLPPTFLADKFI